ncbi:MAG: hypothetical protein KGI04_03725 [Candidatus Micrarchaeota archaeon]|nr:hypothetical protein [Candidatus Micrarchaeota archaeon]
MSINPIVVADKKAGELAEILCLGVIRAADKKNFSIKAGKLSEISRTVVERLEEEGAAMPLRFQENGPHMGSEDVSRAIDGLVATRQAERVDSDRNNGFKPGDYYEITGLGRIVYNTHREYFDGLLRRNGTSLNKLEEATKVAVADFRASLFHNRRR